MPSFRILILAAICTTFLLSPQPAHAQLNPSTILQNANQKINNAGETQHNTQRTIDNNQAPAMVQAQGTILQVQGELIVLNQSVLVNGQTMTVKNKFYMQASTRKPSDTWKPTPNAKVKITFVNASDGRRVIAAIANQ